MVVQALSPVRIAGVILTGGASRRFGADKALALLDGVPLVQHVVERARPQVEKLVLCGRDKGQPGVAVVADFMPSEGPLTGILSGLVWAKDNDMDAIASFPCDTPFYPSDVVARLSAGLVQDPMKQKDCAFARHAGSAHYTFAVWRVCGLHRLLPIYRSGVRSLREALEALDAAAVEFDDNGPDEHVFVNFNHRDELERLEARRSEHRAA